uniref:Ferritin n=1 Tax=Xiphophorus couchianus TaxID=32473 RepID=A0A3B5LEI5_9TELE
MSMSSKMAIYRQDCEAAINRRVNLELYASYVYLWMGYFFDRDDQALHDFATFFRGQSHEEREHAEKLMQQTSCSFAVLSLEAAQDEQQVKQRCSACMRGILQKIERRGREHGVLLWLQRRQAVALKGFQALTSEIYS